MMNKSQKKAMDLAFTQTHIVQACAKDMTTLLALGKSNIKHYCKVNSLPFKDTNGPLVAAQIIDQPTNYIYLDGGNIGFLHGVPYSTKEDFYNLLHSFPQTSYDDMAYFHLTLYYHTNYQTCDSEFILEYLNSVCLKSKKIKKVGVEFECVIPKNDTSAETVPIQHLLNIVYGLNSVDLQCLEFSYLNLNADLFSIAIDEDIMRLNLPNLEQIKIRILICKETVFSENSCMECLQQLHMFNSGLIKFEVIFNHIPSESCITIMKFLNTLCGIYKKVQIVIRNHFVMKDLRKSPSIENCNVKYRVNVEECAVAYITKYNLKKLQTFNSFKVISDTTLLGRNLTYVLFHSKLNIVYSALTIEKIKIYICSFPSVLKSLIFENINFDLNDIGQKLATAYPSLKELGIHYAERNMFHNKVNTNYFECFTKLEILYLDCMEFKEIPLPKSLRVLQLSCSSRIPSSHPSHIIYRPFVSHTSTLKMEYDFSKAKPNIPAQLQCHCYKSNSLFRKCVVNHTYSKALKCIHFNHIDDLDLYEKAQEIMYNV